MTQSHAKTDPLLDLVEDTATERRVYQEASARL